MASDPLRRRFKWRLLVYLALICGCGKSVSPDPSHHVAAQLPADPPLLAELAPESADENEVQDFALDADDGKEFKDALIHAIQSADRIVVKEHSDKPDFYPEFYDENTEQYIGVKEVTYGALTLDARQKDAFLDVIQSMDAATQQAFALCGPVWHHSIEFYSDDQLFSKMLICFECSKISWPGSERTPPGAIYDSLKSLVESIGFSAKRDWKSLARESRSSAK